MKLKTGKPSQPVNPTKHERLYHVNADKAVQENSWRKKEFFPRTSHINL